MRFIIQINCDNAIFHDAEGDFSPYAEVERLLRKVESSLPSVGEVMNLVEKNGNKCGFAGWRK